MIISSDKTTWCSFFAVICCCLILNGFGIISEVQACTQRNQDNSIVFLSVNVVNNTLQLYWENVDYSKYYLVLASHGKVINFYIKREDHFEFWENGKQYVLRTIKPSNSSGFVQTDVKFIRPQLDTIDSSGNQGYYVHITTLAGIVERTYCMRGHPTWMNDYKSQIGDASLMQLFIPGTYHSAAYFTKLSAANFEVVNKYSITQGWEDVRSQLRLGARFLDISISQNLTPEEQFWTFYNVVQMHPLRIVLEQVRKFVEETNEIVIFDIHSFPTGFNSTDDHHGLIQFIRSEIEDFMVSPSVGWDGTLNQIWATGKRIIVCYANAEVVNLYPYHLWPTTHHRLADVDDKTRLKNYFYNKQFTYRNSIPVTDVAALTPSPYLILSDGITHTLAAVATFLRVNPLGNSTHSDALSPGIKHRAQLINQDVTLWYLHDLGRTCNIVAVNYILGSNIVEVAIYWNLRRIEQPLYINHRS